MLGVEEEEEEEEELSDRLNLRQATEGEASSRPLGLLYTHMSIALV